MTIHWLIFIDRRRDTRSHIRLWLWSNVWYDKNLLSTSTISCNLCGCRSTLWYNGSTSYKSKFDSIRIWTTETELVLILFCHFKYSQVTGYQTAQYVAGPTRNVQPQQQQQQQPPKTVVPTAPYNANQAYAPQQAYQQNAPQQNAPQQNAPKRNTIRINFNTKWEK